MRFVATRFCLSGLLCWGKRALVLLALLLASAGTGWAQETFTVTTEAEFSSGDNFSLRDAIEAANANQNPGAVDVIEFNLSGTPPFTLVLEETTLPDVTEPVRIDATTQPGYDGTPAFVIDGSGLPDSNSGDGLVLSFGSDGSTIHGLSIVNFNGNGLRVRSDSNAIGGAVSEGGNVISGNGGAGIEFYYASNNRVTGNYIGTDPSGTVDEGNGGAGVAIVFGSLDNAIGGTAAGARNVISGNDGHGISLTGGDGNPEGNTIAGNYIGTDAGGTAPLPNGGSGIFIDQAVNTAIGSATTEAGNRIAFNGAHGVQITGGGNGVFAEGNAVRHNRIFENTGLGVEVGGDGATANDTGDADAGPNKLQNFPEITEATYGDGQNELAVTYQVPTDPDYATYPLHVDFYLADVDQEEGAVYLGTDTYTADDYSGGPEKTVAFTPLDTLTEGDAIVATATDEAGNTSEFSAAVEVFTPQIRLTPAQLPTPFVGESVDIAITRPEDFQPETSTFYYRPTGTAEYKTMELLLTDDGTRLTGSIPGEDVTVRGVDFYVALSDGTLTLTYPYEAPARRPAWLPARFDELAPPGAFEPGAYRMISIPAAVETADLADVFADYGAYEPQRWRVLRWDPQAETYEDLPDLADVPAVPGRAFWVVTRDGEPFTLGRGQATDASAPVELTLAPGWNQVGNPYAFPVSVAALDLPDAVEGPVGFNGTAYHYAVETLAPWAGYFMYNGTGEPVTIAVPPVEASEEGGADAGAQTAKSGTETPGYTMRLTAQLAGGTLRDRENVIGLTEAADVGRDRMDYAEAPPVGDHVRLSILEGEERLAGSFKPPRGDGQWWDLEVTASVAEALPTRKRVQVRLHEDGSRPDGYRRYVIDRDAGTPVALENGAFSVELSREQPVRRLRVILGTADFAEAHAEGAALDAYADALRPNYPNPFTRATTIPYEIGTPRRVVVEVYNMLGQRVRTLVDARQEAGAYDVQWDGRNAQGVPVASGVYFCRIRAGSYEATRRLVLVR